MMTKEPHPALNAEQEAGARKDAGGFQGSIFVARLKSGPPINYRPNPAPPIQREGEPRITVEPHTNGVSGPATFGPVIVGTPNHELTTCDEPGCEVQHVIPKLTIYIEAERWVDARAFALRKLGVSEAEVKPYNHEEEVKRRPNVTFLSDRPLPRWQVRHVGTSGHPTNGMRMQARQLQNEPTREQAEAWWKDVREI